MQSYYSSYFFAFNRARFEKPRVLVFSKTDGFRHASIEAGKPAFDKMAAEKKFTVDFTENATHFSNANLKKYNAVVFLNTTGDVLNNEQQEEFERYTRQVAVGWPYMPLPIVNMSGPGMGDWRRISGTAGAMLDNFLFHTGQVKRKIFPCFLPPVFLSIRGLRFVTFGKVHDKNTIIFAGMASNTATQYTYRIMTIDEQSIPPFTF